MESLPQTLKENATKEEAEKFANWFDEVLFMLEWFTAAELLVPYGKTPKDAVDIFVKHHESLEKESQAAKARTGFSPE